MTRHPLDPRQPKRASRIFGGDDEGNSNRRYPCPALGGACDGRRELQGRTGRNQLLPYGRPHSRLHNLPRRRLKSVHDRFQPTPTGRDFGCRIQKWLHVGWYPDDAGAIRAVADREEVEPVTTRDTLNATILLALTRVGIPLLLACNIAA